MNNKIDSTHLSRQACVYLRQSTAYQVESNRESTERQYALADRALSLGWDKTQIKILDKDLGKSGQTTSGREDFHQLMAAVSLITAILHNPTYTGTYVYGRRRSRPVLESGQIVGVKTQQLPEPDWKVVIHDAHPAYLSWLEYQQNQEQLKRNYGIIMESGRIGSVREGSALLQGLVICGKCGRPMSPRYYGDNGHRASYECNKLRKQNAQFPMCWSVSATAISEGVATHVLEALTTEQLDISLAVLAELDQQAMDLEHQWQLKLERGRYEASRAERQYHLVEPENRLVARTLEKRWNEKLQQLAEKRSGL